MMSLIAVVNGPNLNLLGSREPDIYGRTTLEDVRARLERKAEELGVEVELFQSNHEGAIIDYLQGLPRRSQGVIINPGALTHYSYALRDALASLDMPIIEVHISNIASREEWRSLSVISPVVTGIIAGLGAGGYELALAALTEMVEKA
jgi:3-dehydroquinate dehydratase-2